MSSAGCPTWSLLGRWRCQRGCWSHLSRWQATRTLPRSQTAQINHRRTHQSLHATPVGTMENRKRTAVHWRESLVRACLAAQRPIRSNASCSDRFNSFCQTHCELHYIVCSRIVLYTRKGYVIRNGGLARHWRLLGGTKMTGNLVCRRTESNRKNNEKQRKPPSIGNVKTKQKSVRGSAMEKHQCNDWFALSRYLKTHRGDVVWRAVAALTPNDAINRRWRRFSDTEQFLHLGKVEFRRAAGRAEPITDLHPDVAAAASDATRRNLHPLQAPHSPSRRRRRLRRVAGGSRRRWNAVTDLRRRRRRRGWRWREWRRGDVCHLIGCCCCCC